MIISYGFNDTARRVNLIPHRIPYKFEMVDEWVFGSNRDMATYDNEVCLSDSILFDATDLREMAYGCVREFEQVDGILGYAAYDSRDNELFVIGDYLGRVPLYYYFSKNLFGMRLLIAPELKCFYGLNRDEVHLLKMGEFITFRNGKFTVESYTTISRILFDGMTEDTALFSTRDLLTKAVQKITRSVRKPCAFLSGGVDSTVVTALVKQEIPDIPCYTFSVGDKGKADLYYARLVAKELNLDLREVVVSQEEVYEHIKEIIYLNEDSSWTQITSAVGQYFLAKAAAKDGCITAITGDMSDEIYASYPQIERWSWKDDQYVQARTKLINKGWINPNRSVKVLEGAGGIAYTDPFSDREFLEFASNTPPQFKDGRIDGKRVNKYLLRKAFSDIIPTQIVTRAKGCQGTVTWVDEMFESEEKKQFIKDVYNSIFNKDGKIVRVEQ